jgi:hypothetical protein
MSMPLEPDAALVLWLIREGIASTWSALIDHFNVHEGSYGPYQLLDCIIALHRIELIEIEGDPIDFSDLVHVTRRGENDRKFSVTRHAFDLFRLLDISLSQLAKTDPDNRMIVDPSLPRTRGAQYKSDILVFMPFTEALRPVYDDHLKSVAANLGRSIKRGDDFFTAKEVIADIWTALLETQLVIVDCTGRNPNVFYELGLAHVVGKPTILIAQNSDDVPFDLRHWRYIEYQLTPRGMKRFEEAIELTIEHSFSYSITP